MRSAFLACALLFVLAQAAAAETIRVKVEQLRFIPAEISAHVGDTIEWVSTDFVAHTATARDGQWDVAIPAQGSGRIVVSQAGEIAYFCRFHPNMTGRIAVAGN